MKLTDLATPSSTKQVAKVFESYFGNNIPFDSMSKGQTRQMLQRVQNLIQEHRRQPEFHRSELNPAYLKLIMMEQGLTSKLQEADAAVAQPNPQALAMQMSARKKEIQDQIKTKQDEIRSLQQQLNQPNLGMGESRMTRRRIKEASEVQQAQVVLAAQDMVDKMQKMLEEVTAMQFKDLPALTDQIKNEVGQQQAAQFNQDATAALSGLVQNLQGAKQQLETALGVVTGQAAEPMPGADLGAAPALPAGDDLTAPAVPPEGEEIDIDADVELGGEAPPASLGRGRR